MIQLFTLSGLSSVQFNCGVKTWSCCGKVNMVISGRNTIGYIVDETATHWITQLGTNHSRKVRWPVYAHDLHTYNFHNKEPRITEYWPIRFKMYTSGECIYTINRVFFKYNTNKIMFQHSS